MQARARQGLNGVPVNVKTVHAIHNGRSQMSVLLKRLYKQTNVVIAKEYLVATRQQVESQYYSEWSD